MESRFILVLSVRNLRRLFRGKLFALSRAETIASDNLIQGMCFINNIP